MLVTNKHVRRNYERVLVDHSNVNVRNKLSFIVHEAIRIGRLIFNDGFLTNFDISIGNTDIIKLLITKEDWSEFFFNR